jgi:histidine triad (HIT) family protein
MDSECIFCKIIAGEIPAEKIYETQNALAFLDIRPNNPGHTLVIPKEHYKNIFDLPQEIWLEMAKTAYTLAPVIKESMVADGINIAMNNEPAAHQIVFHAHIHIIPRLHGDPHQPWVGTPYAEGEAEKVAEKIRNAL